MAVLQFGNDKSLILYIIFQYCASLKSECLNIFISILLCPAFGGDASNPHLPHNHECNQVVYTGTHDNDTVRISSAILLPMLHNYLVRKDLGMLCRNQSKIVMGIWYIY